MPLHRVSTVSDARTALPDSDVVVVVAVYNSYEDVVQCYRAFLAHTPLHVPLLVVDDAGPDRRPIDILDEMHESVGDRDVVVLSQAANKGFVHGMNDAFAATGRSDVVLLNSDVVVGPEWLERLQAAACSSNAVATASALTNHGTILSVPRRNISTSAMPGDLSVDEAARRVAAAALRSRPRLPTAVAHCTYVKRSALDLVGGFDAAFSPGYGEEVDFCQRLVRAGMQHVAADDVFVYHRGGSAFGRSEQVLRLQEEHERLINQRYPYYPSWVRHVSEDQTSALAAAIVTARTALLGMRIAVDGMCMGANLMGTQLVVLETVKALAERDSVSSITVYVSGACPPATRQALTTSPKVQLEVLGSWQAPAAPAYDLVYRPYQVNYPHELQWLRAAAERVVINQLDLIAYHNASYFSSADAWHDYRRLARLVGATVDGVAYISQHVADEAEAEGVVAAGRSERVVYCGTQHAQVKAPSDAQSAPQPHFAARVEDGFLLFLGASYAHKNRHFAIRLHDELMTRGWKGQLVLAGPTPPSGSTAAQEAELFLRRPTTADAVVDLGAVSEQEKAWLYQKCSLVLYPTSAEGFGLVPFEAAAHGRPCLTTRQGSLDEVLPPGILTMEGWDVDAAADVARTLLDDESAADAFVAAILERGQQFTWGSVAEELETLFLEVLSRPAAAQPSSATQIGGTARRPPQSVNKVFVGAVTAVSRRPGLKQALSPSGSRRERYSRAVIRKVGSRL